MKAGEGTLLSQEPILGGPGGAWSGVGGGRESSEVSPKPVMLK